MSRNLLSPLLPKTVSFSSRLLHSFIEKHSRPIRKDFIGLIEANPSRVQVIYPALEISINFSMSIPNRNKLVFMVENISVPLVPWLTGQKQEKPVVFFKDIVIDSTYPKNLQTILQAVQLSCETLAIQNYDKVAGDLAPIRFIDYKKIKTNWLDVHLLKLLSKSCTEISTEKFCLASVEDYLAFSRFSRITIFEVYGLSDEKTADNLFDNYLEALSTFKTGFNLHQLGVPAAKGCLRQLDTVKYGLTKIFSGEKNIGVAWIRSEVYLMLLNRDRCVLIEVKQGFYVLKVVKNEELVKTVVEMVTPSSSGHKKEEYRSQMEKLLTGKKRETFPTVIHNYLSMMKTN